MKRIVPWMIVALAAAWVLLSLKPPRDRSGFNLADFGRLPALLNGRLQPLDSIARNALLLLRSKQSVALEAGQRLSPAAWLAEVAMKPEVADGRKVFRIDHPDLRSLLKLPAEGPNDFSLKEIAAGLAEVEKQAERADRVEPANRSTFERSVIRLQSAITVYERLKNSLRPEGSDDWRAEIADFQKSLGPGLAAWKARQEGKEANAGDLDHMTRLLQRFDLLASVAYLLVIPPAEAHTKPDAWSNIGTGALEAVHSGNVPLAVTRYADMTTAYRKGQAEEFNRALAGYQQWLAAGYPKESAKARREFLFNSWQPFIKSISLYILVFLLGLFSWFGWFQVLNRTAFNLLVLAFLVHTAGIVFRMVLEGRPPVTNLYSSAVFVGWGAVGLGLILERLFRDSVGLVLSATLGLITQVIAHNLALAGDTMEMLRAVLDSNFWLTTHVITITLGYSATFVAGFLGVVYVLRAFLTRGLTETSRSRLARMVYGIVCFATLFSFVGTVLGGIWADQSWGRFWGWDPKENGALIIVLWNAIILHARSGALVEERGLMNLAIFGNAVTSFSWFGVNMLGVGLHSYGFMDKALVWLMIFVASQLALIGLSLFPDRYWASFRRAEVLPTSKSGTP